MRTLIIFCCLSATTYGGDIVLLYKEYQEKTGKPLRSYNQGNYGVCVSVATGRGVDIIAALNNYPLIFSSEFIHAGTKRLSAKDYLTERSYNSSLKSDGQSIEYTIDFIQRYGVVPRAQYGTLDLRQYSGSVSRQLVKDGVDSLLTRAKRYQIRDAYWVRNWAEVCIAIANRHPIIVGSNLGFSHSSRDKNGFAEPCGCKWAHAWVIIGIDNKSELPGACVLNSHGPNWIKGPTRYNQPAGSIWLTPNNIDKMVKNWNRCFAIGNFKKQEVKLW